METPLTLVRQTDIPSFLSADYGLKFLSTMQTWIGVLRLRWTIGGLLLALLVLTVWPLAAQRVRFPAGDGSRSGAAMNSTPPAVTLQPPVATPFDPYAIGPGYGVTTVPSPAPGPVVPVPPPAVGTVPSTGGFAAPPSNQVPQPGTLTVPGQPPPLPQSPLPSTDPNLAPALSGVPYPSAAPQAVFPDGMFPGWQPSLGGWLSGVTAMQAPPYARLFEDFYARYTWIHGESTSTKPDELQIQEVELATSLVIPNTINMLEEFRVTPGFVYDALGGPFSLGPESLPLSLPSNLYSAYLDSYALAQMLPQFSGELNIRLGVYSDFDTITNDSIRLTGRGLLKLQLTPTLTIKGGIEYFGRNKTKMLPAGGVLWEPNPQTRFDIYFPRPKLAKKFTTVGANEIWWYVGGEYGGGAWTVEDNFVGATPPDYKGNIDINDIRIFAGLDFTRPSNLTGFIECGYVFEREIFYKDAALPNVFALQDSFMVRTGIIW